MSCISRKLRRGVSQDIEFVGSSQGTGSSNTLLLSKPVGILSGDLMLAIIVGDQTSNSSRTLTAPAGWSTAFGSEYAGGTTNVRFSIFYKIATSSEDSTYTFTSSNNINSSGCIICYRNANFGFIGMYSNDSGSSITLPEVKIPFDNSILFACLADIDRNGSYSTPSGMSSVISDLDSNVPSYQLFSQTIDAGLTGTRLSNLTVFTGSTGILFFIYSKNNSPNKITYVNSSSTQNTSSGITNLIINKPTDVVENDLLIALMCTTSSETWTGDTGWTEIADQGNTPSLRIAYKVATSSEPSSYTFTSGTTTNTPAGAILAFRNATYDTISALESDASTLKLGSISCAENWSRLIAIYARAAASITCTTPGYMENLILDNDSTSPSYLIAIQEIGYGETDARSSSVGASVSVGGIMLSIKPS